MRRLVASVDRALFAPESTSTLALVRIAYGLMLVGWTVTLAPDLLVLMSEQGPVPPPHLGGTGWSLLVTFPGDRAVLALYVVLLVAAVCVTLGYRTRLASVVAVVALLSFQRRNPWMLNSGDLLVRHLGLYLALAPAGVALSLDRWRTARDRFWEHPARAPWPLRLIQVQLSVLYLFSVWAKVRGGTWNAGTAVGYALRVDDLVRFPVPGWLTDSLVAVNLLTYGTLAVELAIALLVWNRRLRPWVLGAGVALHLAIDLTITVGFFSAALFVAYLAFVPPETADRWLVEYRRRLKGRSLQRHLADSS